LIFRINNDKKGLLGKGIDFIEDYWKQTALASILLVISENYLSLKGNLRLKKSERKKFETDFLYKLVLFTSSG